MHHDFFHISLQFQFSAFSKCSDTKLVLTVGSIKGYHALLDVQYGKCMTGVDSVFHFY